MTLNEVLLQAPLTSSGTAFRACQRDTKVPETFAVAPAQDLSEDSALRNGTRADGGITVLERLDFVKHVSMSLIDGSTCPRCERSPATTHQACDCAGSLQQVPQHIEQDVTGEV